MKRDHEMRTLGATRTFIGLTVLGLAAAALAPSPAAAETASLTVSASVANNCTINTAAISFAPYDPVVANATAALDGEGRVTVACTKGVVPTIALGGGANASGGTRRLASGADLLTYEIYQNSGHTTVWGAAGGAVLTPVAAPSRTARDFAVYGRIAGSQDVPAGTYNDTIVATVNF